MSTTTNMSHAAAVRAGLQHVERDAFGLARIGRTTHDLMGIRYRQADPADNARTAAGAGAEADPGAQSTQEPAATQQTQGGTQGAQQAAGGAGGNDQAVRFEDLDPRTQKYVRDLRAEAANERAAAAQQAQEAAAAKQQRDAVLAALGIKPDGSQADPDPAELQTRIQTTQAEAENTKRENLVLRLGPGLGANVDRLLDSVSFRSKLSALAVDDREGMTALISEAIGLDPSLKAAPPAATASGGTQHTGTTQTGERKSKSAALAERYGSGGRRAS